MNVEQRQWTQGTGWTVRSGAVRPEAAGVVLAFGSTALLEQGDRLCELRRAFPRARLFGCSTAGEVCGVSVRDDSIVATAVAFDSARVEGVSLTLQDATDSRAAGRRLAEALAPEGLAHVFVLSDGLRVNGSDLVAGLTDGLPGRVTVTGGLAGDGARFARTLVVADGAPSPDTLVALGFYGDRLRVGFGSLGGWDPFGPERLITRAQGNVLFEVDGKPALELYKTYLGEHANGLPATGLLFPLSVRPRCSETSVVRTILSVDEPSRSITFAGDVPEGAYARLMKANFDRLIDGAIGAAHTSYEAMQGRTPDLAVLISCVGRKLVLGQRTEEEIEGVRDVLGAATVLAGFYSYGEISPFTPSARCELHNQTMTITTFSER